MKQTFVITGMHCASCKMLIEDIVGDVKGVTLATLDMKTGKLVVEGNFSSADVVKEVLKEGKYTITVQK